MKKKVLTLLLIAAQLSLIACGNSQADTQDTDDNATTTVAETTSYYDTLNLPDFGGDTFTILARTNRIDEVFSETETGDVVSDAIFQRNQAVEDRLNINIEVIDQAGDWANKANFLNYVNSNIMAGDDAFQLIMGYMNYMPSTVTEDLYMNINDLPYIDLDQTWWTSGFNDNAEINGKLYLAMGDMCLLALKNAYCVYANSTLLEQYGHNNDELYTAVREGTWTFDMLTEIAKNVSSDLDGDGDLDVDDLHGIGMHTMPLRALVQAFGIDLTTRDSNGMPQIALYGERLISAYEKVMAVCQSDYRFNENNAEKFRNNRTMFYFEVLNSSAGTHLREMESNYAVLPMPKYDEEQESYRTETVDESSIMLIPITVKNTELVGAALEALNYESNRLIVPAYFNTALQSKYARDEESIEMMEIIRQSMYYDFGYIFAGAIGGCISSIMAQAEKGTGIASYWDSMVGTMETNLSKLLEYFEE